VRGYRSLARTALQQTIAYRGGFFLSLLGTVFFLLSMIYLWRTIVGTSGAIHGFDWPELKAYLAVGFLGNTLVSSWVDWSMSDRIRTGAVAADLVRPLDYQRARLAETLGVAVFELATALVLLLVMAAVFGGFALPGPAAAGLFLVSLALVLPVKFALVYGVGLVCFWTQNYLGVEWARAAVTNLLSGAFVPLVFFPGWLQHVASVLPFQAIASTPALIYLGRTNGGAALVALAVQATWAVALWVGARLLWSAAVRQLTVHGG
jgi:ABC-2 type transport system permease protein